MPCISGGLDMPSVELVAVSPARDQTGGAAVEIAAETTFRIHCNGTDGNG